MTLIERLIELAAAEREVAAGMDMDLEHTANERYARTADAARARIAELEADNAQLLSALWMALDGREVVVRSDTPRNLEWHTTDDGGRLVRRAVST